MLDHATRTGETASCSVVRRQRPRALGRIDREAAESLCDDATRTDETAVCSPCRLARTPTVLTFFDRATSIVETAMKVVETAMKVVESVTTASNVSGRACKPSGTS